MKGVCVYWRACVACMIHEVHGKRERRERETEKETASKGSTVDFSAPPSRDLGGRVEGEARGESFLSSLLCFCLPPPPPFPHSAPRTPVGVSLQLPLMKPPAPSPQADWCGVRSLWLPPSITPGWHVLHTHSRANRNL